ncbi:DUF7793 family protein [Aurantibacillus circumpalustris]|uniref:DUF7793 family protein n=1 Tax=Aurantibacillus circumpalustris TaxID=3036359 RepID=UPI00295A67F0|nr:hypothetical protein [Aurantibacillus circumpalustris]
MQNIKIVKTKINKKYVDKEGFLRIKVIDGVHIDLPALKEDAAVNMTLTNNQKALALYDSRAFFTIDQEARDYVKSGITDPTRIATAVLTDKLATTLLVNFFIRFNKPSTPMKMFTCEKKALQWLRKFQKK